MQAHYSIEISITLRKEEIRKIYLNIYCIYLSVHLIPTFVMVRKNYRMKLLNWVVILWQVGSYYLAYFGGILDIEKGRLRRSCSFETLVLYQIILVLKGFATYIAYKIWHCCGWDFRMEFTLFSFVYSSLSFMLLSAAAVVSRFRTSGCSRVWSLIW